MSLITQQAANMDLQCRYWGLEQERIVCWKESFFAEEKMNCKYYIGPLDAFEAHWGFSMGL